MPPSPRRSSICKRRPTVGSLGQGKEMKNSSRCPLVAAIKISSNTVWEYIFISSSWSVWVWLYSSSVSCSFSQWWFSIGELGLKHTQNRLPLRWLLPGLPWVIFPMEIDRHTWSSHLLMWYRCWSWSSSICTGALSIRLPLRKWIEIIPSSILSVMLFLLKAFGTKGLIWKLWSNNWGPILTDSTREPMKCRLCITTMEISTASSNTTNKLRKFRNNIKSRDKLAKIVQSLLRQRQNWIKWRLSFRTFLKLLSPCMRSSTSAPSGQSLASSITAKGSDSWSRRDNLSWDVCSALLSRLRNTFSCKSSQWWFETTSWVGLSR